MGLDLGTGADGPKEASEIWIGTADGARPVVEGWVGASDGARQFFAAGGEGGDDLSVAIDPPSQDWTGSFGDYSANVSVEVSGGTAPYGIVWVAGDGASVTSPTASSTLITSGVSAPVLISVSVTDSLGRNGGALGSVG